MTKDLKALLTLLISLLSLSACESDNPECLNPTAVTTQVSFGWKRVYDTTLVTDSTATDTIITSYVDSILLTPSLLSLDVDSPILFYGDRTSYLSIQFNPATDSIRYLFQPDNDAAEYDTVTFKYTSQLHFISNACGYTYYYNLDTVFSTYHILDSVAITNREVTSTASTRHVRLYFF